jgi:hypothetical protein
MKNSKKETIFVQIASYRDPELLPTLRDCISKAKYPEKLVFSIAWQHCINDTWDDLSEFLNDPRFKIIDIDYRDSKGACWARNKLQQLYSNEEYTLQLDSHHRFIENWDEECINMIKMLQDKGYKKPLLTGYIPSYEPDNDPDARINVPWKMNFDRFIPEGAVFFLPSTIDNWETLTEPIPSRFYSAHFCFTIGQFVKEVPHDPDYYFHGEEISIAVRAYTWGYDLFHPHKVIAWHEYTRNGRTKQWDDDRQWSERNRYCHKKNRQLFGMDGEVKPKHFGIYDFGTVRTLNDYEKYAGISFSKRAVTQYNIDNQPPYAQSISDEDFEKSLLMIFKHCIDISFSSVPLDDYDFWAVAFENEVGETIYRQDADADEIRKMKSDPSGYCKLWRTFNILEKPYKWVVWPHSKSAEWGTKMEGLIYNE